MPSIPSPFASGDYPADKFDPDYLYYLRHTRHAEKSNVLELPSNGASPLAAVKYEDSISNSDCECISDPSPGRGSTDRGVRERGSLVEAGAPSSWLDSLVNIDEDYRVFLQHTRVVNNCLRLEFGGVVVNYGQVPDAADSGGSSGVEEGTNEEKDASVVSPANEVDSDELSVISKPIASDWRADPTPEKTTGGQEYMRRHGAESRVAPSHISQGVIWPRHIINRPESDFKRRLLDALNKPFSRKEYIKLFDMASIRTPLVKLRQVRNDSKFYPTEEMGNSYFDHYPDFVQQVMNTSYSNGLALMRGFFFWLQNTAHEDQFMPWFDESKDQEVIPLMD